MATSRSTKSTRSSRTAKTRTARTPKTARRTRKPVVAEGATISYPFKTKAQIAAKISNDPAEAFSALATIVSLDAAMSSQKKLAKDLHAEVLEAGDKAAKNEDLVGRVTALALRYTRRLAKHERGLALKADKSLKPFVTMFSATV